MEQPVSRTVSSKRLETESAMGEYSTWLISYFASVLQVVGNLRLKLTLLLRLSRSVPRTTKLLLTRNIRRSRSVRLHRRHKMIGSVRVLVGRGWHFKRVIGAALCDMEAPWRLSSRIHWTDEAQRAAQRLHQDQKRNDQFLLITIRWLKWRTTSPDFEFYLPPHLSWPTSAK